MKDFLIVVKMFFKNIVKYAGGIPVLVLSYFLYSLLMNVFNGFALSLGSSLMTGFIRWFLLLAMMAHFAGLMTELFRKGKLTMEDLSIFNSYYIGPLSRLFFVFYLVEMLANMFIFRLGFTSEAYLVILIIWETVKAPALEAVYISNIEVQDYFYKLIVIWKENILTCLTYLAICFYVYLTVGRQYSLISMIPGSQALPYILVHAVIMTIFMYTKGILYKILTETSPQSRAYREGQER